MLAGQACMLHSVQLNDFSIDMEIHMYLTINQNGLDLMLRTSIDHIYYMVIFIINL